MVLLIKGGLFCKSKVKCHAVFLNFKDIYLTNIFRILISNLIFFFNITLLK